jgi:hypothetical protein
MWEVWCRFAEEWRLFGGECEKGGECEESASEESVRELRQNIHQFQKIL